MKRMSNVEKSSEIIGIEALLNGSGMSITMPHHMAEQDRFQDLRWSLLCEAAERKKFIDKISLVDFSPEMGVQLDFTDKQQNRVTFIDKRKSPCVPSSTLRVSGLKIFCRSGLKHYLSTNITDAKLFKGGAEPLIALSEIAEVYNGKLMPLGDQSAEGISLDAIGHNFPKDFQKDWPIITAKSNLPKKVFPCGSNDRTITLRNAIILKNFYYNLDEMALLKSITIVKGPVRFAVEKGVHVIELDPYIDERYINHLFMNFVFTSNFFSQLIHYNKTYYKITVNDLNRILVSEPSAMSMQDDGLILKLNSAVLDKIAALKKNNPLFEITPETFKNHVLVEWDKLDNMIK